MKPLIIADSSLADAFRVAGIAVLELEGADGVAQAVRQIRERGDIGIVLVDERYMESVEQAFAGGELPMVASFPSEQVEHKEAYIDELTRRYLGQKIYVGGEEPL